MRRKFILFIPLLFLSLALTSCTSELGGLLEAIDKGLSRTDEVEESKIQISKDYYTKDDIPNRPNTYGNLKKFLKSRILPSDYERGKFDCSEMSAFLECKLQQAGFDAYIAEGPAPFPPRTNHAWVFVRTTKENQTYWVPIEATDPRFYNVDEGVTLRKIFSRLLKVPGLVTRSNSSYYLGYFKYDHLYNSIYDIPKSKLGEYDWWKSFY